MSTKPSPEQVARAFEQTGFPWILKMRDRDVILAEAAREIEEFHKAYQARFHEPVHIDPFDLLEDNPMKAAAFFQTFAGAPVSTDMRIMAWRLALGAEVASLMVSYERDRPVSIRIHLVGEDNAYESNRLWDYQILRNIGLLAINGEPILEGFYATRTATGY